MTPLEKVGNSPFPFDPNGYQAYPTSSMVDCRQWTPLERFIGSDSSRNNNKNNNKIDVTLVLKLKVLPVSC
jgi:hypothetical protein